MNRPPVGFTSEWAQRGGVRTRVVGATITFPTLTDDTRREFPSRTAALLIWVETQNITGGVALRRWIGLNEAAALRADGAKIAPAKFPPGARVGGELEGSHSLIRGGPGVVDVLAFEVPPASARDIVLLLTGSHVGESGSFAHGIPYDVWSKK